MTTSKIFVPLGLRREGERLMRIAGQVAAAYGVPIEAVHVVDSVAAYTAAGHHHWMQTLVAQYPTAQLRLVEHASISGGLRDVIVDDPEAMVCMAVDASGGGLDGILGSVSEDLLRAGHHRFVLIGPDVDATHSISEGPVVVCADGSDLSEAIVPLAAEWAEVTSKKVWTVQAAEGPVPPDVTEAAYVRSIASRFGDLDAEFEVLHDERHPADAIVAFADGMKAGSIAMATHGRGRLARFALGSVAIRVVHNAHCPVFVSRPASVSVTPPAPAEQS